MKLHVLGICGTFMGGVAALARELGHEVEGSDANVYPPMSTQLESLGIALRDGYAADNLQPAPDQVVVGNALSRGNPAVEYMLDAGLDYVSGPQWLGETLLRDHCVLAVAGTHGKTTTSSMLAWLLECAGHDPGFLIGGVPGNFGVSARLGGSHVNSPITATTLPPRSRGEMPKGQRGGNEKLDQEGVQAPASAFSESQIPIPNSRPFVIEADEYDTAFFDKRSKFVHYRPTIAVLNNLEYDHADIFPDLAAIERQFHHLIRTVPGNGRLIVNVHDENLARVLDQGCWTPVDTFGIDKGDWQASLIEPDGSVFSVRQNGQLLGEVHWSMQGRHNVLNGLAALAAASVTGVDAKQLLAGFASFTNVKRRMETVAKKGGVHIYDDFAHHPTAIASTLEGLRAKVGKSRIVVALEPRSNSMRQGVHASALAPSLADADAVVFLQRPELAWDAQAVVHALDGRGQAVADVTALIECLKAQVQAGDSVVFMSNGGFENAPRRLAEALSD